MEGPIAEVNLSKVDLDWNGAIAFLDRDGVLNYGSPNYINSPEELKHARLNYKKYFTL